VQAAIELVAKRGWDAVTTRQIADSAGVNQALIHYHFGSKERLLHAAFDRAVRGMFMEPVTAMIQAPTLAEGAAGLVMALRELDESVPEVLFGFEALSRSARDETIRTALAELLAELRGIVAERIEEGQRTGSVRRDLDPVGTATALGALFDGLGFHFLVDRRIDVERTAAAVQALLTPPSADPSTREEAGH
jgi:AcrR family transcriptional regulator